MYQSEKLEVCVMVLSFLKYLRGIFNTALKSQTVHHAVIQSIYDAFVMVDGDLNLMRLEMCLSTATGKWLDHWGDFFAVHRKLKETDSAYAKRIIEYVIRPKTTVPAIKDHIVEFLNDKYHADYTAEDVDIKEPWKELAKYSHQGLLSSTSRFFSGNYYCHSVIDVSVPEALTQDLIDLVMAVKAAGVKVIWSFLNSYDIVSSYTESNNNWANYIRHIITQTQRNTYSGLLLSNTSLYPTLSGRREIWFELHTLYCWYAKMLDKDTDKSIIITKNDLAALLDYYEYIEQVFNVADTGLKVSVDGVLSNLKMLSGDITKPEAVKHLVKITENVIASLQLVDDWLTLSYKGKLSTPSGILFQFEASRDLLSKILDTIDKFKQENRDYYNALQPPILMGEQAQYLVPRNNNWLFNTPAMSQQDFYDLWEVTNSTSLQNIFDYEQQSEKHYLTFGDVYQPPIVIAGSPWDWTPILDNPWLWASATLTSEELEEIYRMKFSGFPDLVEIQTTTITHPEYNFTLSDGGKLSEVEYVLTTKMVHSSEPSFRLSEDGKLSDSKVVSGEEIQAVVERVKNENFTRYTFLSGDKSTVTKHYTVTENTPTLGTLIDFEENQDIFNPNEKIQYSTRDWMQAPIQIGEFAQWLIASHTKQLWDTLTMTNEEIMSFWDKDDTPEQMIKKYLQSSIIYQPPIVRADCPFYWLNTQDIPWLWESATLNNEELEEVYREKFSEHPELFPDVVTKTRVTIKNPVTEFRLSDNGHMPDNHVQVDVTEVKHPELGFTLSQNSIISNRKTEYRTNTETIPHPENSFRLSQNSAVSARKYDLEITTISHTENNFVLSFSTLDNTFQVSGGDIEQQSNWVPNSQFAGYHYLSGNTPEIIKTVEPITYDELPLKFMSGGKTDVTTKYSLVLDGKGIHRLSGDKSNYAERIDIEEKVVTLGTLIDWEEQQLEVLYSTRYVLQSQVIVLDQIQVLWYVQPDFTQLWNTPVISNKEIREYWEGNPHLISLKKLEQILLNSDVKYQAPFEWRPKPFDWTIAIQEHLLWDSPIISNEEIFELWYGDNKPSSLQELKEQIIQSKPRYQPPVVTYMDTGWITTISDTPWLWSSETLINDELEELYNARGLGNTLGNLIHLEEHGSVPYSPRGLFQSPVQVTQLQ